MPTLSIDTFDLSKFSSGDFIVLADDDVDDQDLLIEAVYNIDPEVKFVTITNGNKAISFLKNLPKGVAPRLIVVDYNLPEVNGSEVLEQLCLIDKFKEVVKVVWSTSDSPVYKKACFDFGAHAYMVKPSDIKGIESLARKILDMAPD